MSIQQTKKTVTSGVYNPPSIVRDILELKNNKPELESSVDILTNKYPQFFQRILDITNSDHFHLNTRVTGINQAVTLLGVEPIMQLALIQIVYRSLNQYKIKGVDMLAFWQDSLHRAVCAKKIASLKGMDENLCFNAAFMQDIGCFILFLEQPQKGVLWSELRRREPQARLNMEQNIFHAQHDHQINEFMQAWEIFPEIASVVSQHHDCHSAQLNESDNQLCKVLNCADWMAAVFTADDKSYVIDRCRKNLTDDFELPSLETEKILEAVPYAVEASADILGIKINECMSFSKIVYAENSNLNEHNSQFQEVTARLDQALDERDKLAQEINRDLTLAREIQQSLLPQSRGNAYPLNGINISAKILSGDFYDFFELDNGDIYFNLGDVSGKGVNAALLMAKTCSLFRCLGKRIEEPGKLLYEINNELCETSIHGMFVTMVAGVYSPTKNIIRLVNAGNPPALLLLENGLCQEFEATAPPLGIMQNTVYSEYEINLENGSLYLYSDGLTEGYINDNEMLELSGLFKLIAGMQKKHAPIERLNKIINKVIKTSKPLRDDVTLLLLEKYQVSTAI